MNSREHNIVIAHYRPDVVSGAENSIADLADQLDLRFTITMLIPAEGNLASFYRSRGFNVWIKKVETPRRLYPGLHTVQSIALARELRRRSFDLMLCNTLPAAERVITACRLANLPRVIYMRDYIQNTPTNKQVLRHADAVFCISKDVKNHLKDIVEEKKAWLAYNYIQPDPILRRGEAHKASGTRLVPFLQETPVVGLVGRITPYKQPDLFIRAIPHVLDVIPQARFVLIGAAQAREKPYEERVKTLADNLGIQDKVVFMGLRNDAVELTSEFQIACLASGREPLGRVVLEAQLLKVPVVVPNRGGPAEIVENNVTGLHFDSNSASAEVHFAKQIVRLLHDSELRNCLAAKAHERVLDTFASQKHVKLQEEYIDKICEKGRDGK